MTKQQALEVMVEMLKRTPISFVEGFGVNEAVMTLKAEDKAPEGTVPFKPYKEPKQ